MRFEDVPEGLSGRELGEWLERAGLVLVDFMSWKRARDPLARERPPSRRKFLSPKERAELDNEIEHGERPLW